MLRIHPTPGSRAAGTRPSGSTQAPALFLEVSASRAEGLREAWQMGGQPLDLFLRLLGITLAGGGGRSADISFPKENTILDYCDQKHVRSIKKMLVT